MLRNDPQIDIGTEHSGECFNVQNICGTLCLYTRDNEPAQTIVFLTVEQAEQLAVAAVEFLNVESDNDFTLFKEVTVSTTKTIKLV